MIDTASIYADWLGQGKSISEKTIGAWLVSSGCRENIIISTKGGHHDLQTLSSRLDLSNVRDDIQHSLENMHTDYIDIYWLHKDDLNQTPESLIEMLNEAAPKEYAHYLGVSNWTYDRIRTANNHAKKCGLRPIIASQIQYSIAKPNYQPFGIVAMTDSEYRKYTADTLNVFAFSSQAKGFFSKLDTQDADALPDNIKKLYLNQQNLNTAEKLKELSQVTGLPIPSLVLAALLSNPDFPVFAQIGPRRLEELFSSLQAMDATLSASQRDWLLQ